MGIIGDSGDAFLREIYETDRRYFEEAGRYQGRRKSGKRTDNSGRPPGRKNLLRALVDYHADKEMDALSRQTRLFGQQTKEEIRGKHEKLLTGMKYRKLLAIFHRLEPEIRRYL